MTLTAPSPSPSPPLPTQNPLAALKRGAAKAQTALADLGRNGASSNGNGVGVGVGADIANGRARTIDPEAVLAQMSSEEKIALLSGDDMWHTAPNARLGVPRVRCSDGPNGVRGTAWTNGAPASCFPCATALGASFDVGLVRRIGVALGEECRARGVHCLLGPTTNVQRHPCGGRGFESYGEDPHLSGTLALAWVQGVQSCKVMTTPKHYVGNEQEHHRRSINSVIDERTLHEIYLEPFRLQMKANPSVFMSSYNKVNGIHVAESPLFLRKILKDDWGFSGMIMSDWSGTTAGWEGLKAGLDLEMPGPTMVRGAAVERDMVTGKLRPEDVDACALRVLHYVREAQESGIPFEAAESSIDTPAVRALLREAASAGVVLLKNDAGVLPVSLAPAPALTSASAPGSLATGHRPVRKIAVIGPNADYAAYAGGGSASLLPTYKVTPLQAIRDAMAEAGSDATVEYAIGADGSRFMPLLTEWLEMPRGVEDEGVVAATFYDKDPWAGEEVQSLFRKCNNSAFTYFIDGIPKSVPVRGFVSLKTVFKPHVGGTWILGLGVAGQADLYVDGKPVVQNSKDQKEGLLFRFGEIEVEVGKKYEFEVRFSNFKQLNSHSPYSGRRGGIRIGGRPKYDPKVEIAKAVKLSQEADVTIVVIGTNGEWESEAYDRTSMSLPPGTDDLVRAILAATPSAIIANQSGMPVALPWVDECSTLLQAFMGGNECGRAVADVVFGVRNPSGKLPVTWSRRLEDWPSHTPEGFGGDYDTVYTEGVEVGYRYFDRPGKAESLFEFGYGLSYSEFAFRDLQVEVDGCAASATFSVENTSSVPGAEVAQVYVHQARPSLQRPDIELGGFVKVELGPGESKTVTVELDHKAFSHYSVQNQAWIADKGDYEIRVGSSSKRIHLAKPARLGATYRWIGLRAPERV